jgi:universal stress protein E
MKRILALLDPDRERQPAVAAAEKIAARFGAEVLQAVDLASIEPLGPDLVVSFSAWQSPLQRTLFTADDWRLIRECRVPVLLVKDPTLLSRPRILACVDPTHAGDKPAALDHELLDEAERFARALDGEVRVLHVLTHRHSFAVAGDAYVTPVGAAETGHAGIEQAEQALRGLLAAHPAFVGHGRVRIGTPADEIVAEAREQRASLVVMGAVARGRLERWIVGSTAEGTLDRLACNVLVVKPVARGTRPIQE